MAAPATRRFVLYDNALAYFPGRARLALVEKGVPFESREVNLFDGESLRPAYLKVNPAGTVPALADAATGEVLATQSRAIVDLVDGLGGAPIGAGSGADGASADRALVKQWVDRIADWDGNLYVAAASPSTAKMLGSLTAFKIKFAEARAKEHPDLAATYAAKIASMRAAEADAADAAKCDANRAQLLGILDAAEAQLAETPFLAGQAYSAADVLMTPLLFRTGLAGQTRELLQPRPHLSDYYGRMKARPSFAKVFGPAQSGATAARAILPAVGKAVWARVTGRY